MSLIYIEFITLIHQTNLVHKALKAIMDVEGLNVTDLGELIRCIEWKTV